MTLSPNKRQEMTKQGKWVSITSLRICGLGKTAWFLPKTSPNNGCNKVEIQKL